MRRKLFYRRSPSAQVEDILRLAEKLADEERAPAFTLHHLLLAVLLKQPPPNTQAVQRLTETIREVWEKGTR